LKNYKHIFFDLDHTLWDFDTNSKLALNEMYELNQLKEKGIYDFNQFYQTYKPINDQFWYLYHNNKVNKEELRLGRFRETLTRFSIDDEDLIKILAEQYLKISPSKTTLMPNAIEVLNHLQSRYEIHIITNGFAEVQRVKIENSGLKDYFKNVLISEEIGFQKPQPEIFHHAFKLAETSPEKSIMIGDSLSTDIEGAQNAGMDSIYFNPHNKWHKYNPTFEIRELIELKEML
jgi:putative hydrolase of the HAD superfamily